MGKTSQRVVSVLAGILLPLPLYPRAGHAQGSAGQIEGTVRDDQGGVLPGVTMSVRN